MRCLVVGGAGYVGSHTVAHLIEQGHDVWAYDNLSTGHAAAVSTGHLIVGELLDGRHLTKVLRDLHIEAVCHFAACTLVQESGSQPAAYYRNNVVGSLTLLDAMRAAGVHRLVFSSTAAVYGQPLRMPVTEDTPLIPTSPYGSTKLAVELAIEDYAAAYGIGAVVLRYFNAAGARSDGSLGEAHRPESHLIPLALQVALGQRPELLLCGNDYPTPDGTCIRDYVHVDDLAAAHCLALHAVEFGSVVACNLGSGHGHSVREVHATCEQVTGAEIPYRIAQRRGAEASELIANIARAKALLGWSPRYSSLEEIVATAWRWHSLNPNGYAANYSAICR